MSSPAPADPPEGARTEQTSSARENTAQPPRPVSGLFARARGVMLAPRREFEAIAAEPQTIFSLFNRYLFPLAVIAPIATILGMTAFDVHWSADIGYRVPRDRIFSVGVMNFWLEVGTVFLIATVFYFMLMAHQVRRSYLAALKVALFGAVPVMLMSATLVISLNIIITMLATVHSLFLYAIGAEKVFGLEQGSAGIFVAVSMTIVLGVSSLAGALMGSVGWIVLGG